MFDPHPVDRAVSPVFGALAMLAVTACLATVVVVGFGAMDVPSTSPRSFDLSVDAEDGEVSLRHVAGDPVDVEALSIVVEVDGEALDEQPPVPFAGATGFEGAPAGPFNARTDPAWAVGERAAFRVAGTNDPGIEPGDDVAVSLSIDGTPVARLEATAS